MYIVAHIVIRYNDIPFGIVTLDLGAFLRPSKKYY